MMTSIDVRHGHFGGGDEVEVVHLAVIHLSLFVGQLSGAVSAGLVDHCGRHYLLVSGCAGFVEEEVDECALESGPQSAVHGKSCACDFDAEVKIDEVVFFCQLPVWQFCLTVVHDGCPVAHGVAGLALAQTRLHHQVVFGSGSFGHQVVGNVGYGTELSLHLGLGFGLAVFQCLVGLFQRSHFGFHGLGLVTQSLLHESANLGSQLFGFGEVLVELCLCLTAYLVGGDDFLYGLGRTGEMLLLQATYYALGFFGDKFQCKHSLCVICFFSAQNYNNSTKRRSSGEKFLP